MMSNEDNERLKRDIQHVSLRQDTGKSTRGELEAVWDDVNERSAEGGCKAEKKGPKPNKIRRRPGDKNVTLKGPVVMRTRPQTAKTGSPGSRIQNPSSPRWQAGTKHIHPLSARTRCASGDMNQRPPQSAEVASPPSLARWGEPAGVRWGNPSLARWGDSVTDESCSSPHIFRSSAKLPSHVKLAVGPCPMCGYGKTALSDDKFGGKGVIKNEKSGLAFKKGLNDMSDEPDWDLRKYTQLQNMCETQKAELEAAHRDVDMLRAKLADLVDMNRALQRKDVSLEHFFRRAMRPPFSVNSHKGSPLYGRVQVPSPRFWGNPDVVKYDMQHLRDSIASMDTQTTTSPHFPRTEEEIKNEAARDVIEKEHHGIQLFEKLAREFATICLGKISSTATRPDVIQVFENSIPGMVPGNSCIVYAVNRSELSFWCARSNAIMTLPKEAICIPCAVVASKKSVLISDVQKHKAYYPPVEVVLGYARESAIASPCFNASGQVDFVLEVTGNSRIHYTRFDRMFLELAGMLLMLMIRRTELAEETLEAIRARDLVVQSACLLSSSAFIQSVNNFAYNCQLAVCCHLSRVWLVDKEKAQIFLNTDDKRQLEARLDTTMPSEEDWFVAIMEDYLDLRKVPCFLSLKQRESVSHGPLGAAVHFKEKSKVFRPGAKPFLVDEPAHDESYEKVGLSFACVPIEDRSGNVLGVLEVGNKVYATTGLIQGFSEEDMKMIEAFSKILANYIEHSRFVLGLRSISAGMQAQFTIYEKTNVN